MDVKKNHVRKYSSTQGRKFNGKVNMIHMTLFVATLIQNKECD
jgi:hypothetical protein